ncbi:endonuclease/exonuclease/phosphatase family protein [Anatilimnocola floriformis]|uniref:endonuclease/exonuclease/phosphatase family protein n=1 Tax=Anatilimnocola floriformis TaxID=2948575 RepID=UPI0020C44AF8|nr:endonuclease/exonuclease/phosphatase family protein [Anatilimnocola floriformis]
MFAALALAATSPLAAQPAAENTSLQVMTWNIRYDNANDGVDRWRNRRDWVAEIILREKVDLAGFQEVLAGQFHDLQERLPEFASYGAGRNDGKQQGEMSPIFYRKERFELLDKGTFWLSTTPEEIGSKGWDAALPRIASWLKLQDRQTKESLTVLNTHFDHQGTKARRASAELIVKQVREKFATLPLIFIGDLNSLPDSAAYETLAAKGTDDLPLLRDAYVAAKSKEGPDSTWNGFKKIVPGSRIDYLFATRQWDIEKLSTLTDQRDGRFPSDHLPIVCRLSLRK